MPLFLNKTKKLEPSHKMHAKLNILTVPKPLNKQIAPQTAPADQTQQSPQKSTDQIL